MNTVDNIVIGKSLRFADEFVRKYFPNNITEYRTGTIGSSFHGIRAKKVWLVMLSLRPGYLTELERDDIFYTIETVRTPDFIGVIEVSEF